MLLLLGGEVEDRVPRGVEAGQQLVDDDQQLQLSGLFDELLLRGILELLDASRRVARGAGSSGTWTVALRGRPIQVRSVSMRWSWTARPPSVCGLALAVSELSTGSPPRGALLPIAILQASIANRSKTGAAERAEERMLKWFPGGKLAELTVSGGGLS